MKEKPIDSLIFVFFKKIKTKKIRLLGKSRWRFRLWSGGGQPPTSGPGEGEDPLLRTPEVQNSEFA